MCDTHIWGRGTHICDIEGLGTPTLYTRTPVAVISPPSNEKTKGLCRFMPTT